jgi:proprotein convertase subtilisin/kexin type 2
MHLNGRMSRQLALAAAVALGIAGCGGGGGGGEDDGSSNPTPNTPSGDPLYGDQWHLKNIGQAGAGSAGFAGEDVNAEPVWNSCTDASCRGEGVRVAVVDDGLEIGHEDLSTNVVAGASYDYTSGDNDPSPTDGVSAHGTAVGGIIASRDGNDLGGRGVAPRAELVGYNLLQSTSLGSDEGDAMTRGGAAIYISSNSWGAPDGTGRVAASSSIWQDAINSGLTNGRNGRGTIYIWAAGNGNQAQINGNVVEPIDNSNHDGQANYRGVMAVGAVTDRGVKSSYSEQGANLWLAAPGGEFCSTHTITTTDLSGTDGINNADSAGNGDYGNSNYTRCMNGTSSATPVVSGVVALVLQANPNLGWRDVRAVLAQSARKNDAGDSDWATNGANYNINHKYGFGVPDAEAAVQLAKTWTNYPAEVTPAVSIRTPNAPIPDGDATGVSDTATITGSGISKIEWVEVTFSATKDAASRDLFYGDVEVTLTSPAGTASRLADTHSCPSGCSPYSSWRFGSARHLGEAADGNWVLTVKDRLSQDTGTFDSWQLKIYGH